MIDFSCPCLMKQLPFIDPFLPVCDVADFLHNEGALSNLIFNLPKNIFINFSQPAQAHSDFVLKNLCCLFP